MPSIAPIQTPYFSVGMLHADDPQAGQRARPPIDRIAGRALCRGANALCERGQCRRKHGGVDLMPEINAAFHATKLHLHTLEAPEGWQAWVAGEALSLLQQFLNFRQRHEQQQSIFWRLTEPNAFVITGCPVVLGIDDQAHAARQLLHPHYFYHHIDQKNLPQALDLCALGLALGGGQLPGAHATAQLQQEINELLGSSSARTVPGGSIAGIVGRDVHGQVLD